jgi:hypothetical protein
LCYSIIALSMCWHRHCSSNAHQGRDPLTTNMRLASCPIAQGTQNVSITAPPREEVRLLDGTASEEAGTFSQTFPGTEMRQRVPLSGSRNHLVAMLYLSFDPIYIECAFAYLFPLISSKMRLDKTTNFFKTILKTFVVCMQFVCFVVCMQLVYLVVCILLKF